MVSFATFRAWSLGQSQILKEIRGKIPLLQECRHNRPLGVNATPSAK